MKYRFEITYANSKLIQINEFMSKLDLGEGEFAVVEKFEITCSKNNDINKLKSLLNESLTALGCKVYKIEGGSFE